MRRKVLLLLAVLAGPVPAAAGELSLGLGYDNLFGQGSGAATLALQAGTDPRWHLGPVGFGLGAAGELDTDGDLWAGGVFTAVWPLRDSWRIDGSLMAGFYAFGDGGDDLGSDLEFRTRLGLSRAIAPPWRLGVAIEHKSNGGIGEINPGVETIYLALSRAF
jgi:hypothetical protein